jgi:hypothetical protein
MTLTEPTPRTFSSRFCSTWLAQVVSSCALCCCRRREMATLKTGWAGRVEARDARVLDLVAQQRADQRDLLAHVLGGLAAIDVEVELR